MLPGSDPLHGPPSFTARRPAATNLPNFELPPPPSALSKYQPFAAINGSQSGPTSGSIASVGNLLTPPNTLPSESLSPVPVSMQHNGSSSYPTSGYWGHQSQSQSQPQYPYQPNPVSQWQRGLFSPLNSIVRNSNSPTASEGLPPPPFEVAQLPPFTMSSSSSLPAMSANQQQHMLVNPLMSAPHSMPSTASQHTSPVSAHDPYSARPPPTPTYYSHSQSSSSSLPNAYSFSSGPSPNQLQANMQAQQPQRPSPHTDLSNMSSTTQSPNQYQRPFGQFPLPAMTGGPVMSNLHSPSGQMSLVGGMSNNIMPGFNSGHAANMHMYGIPSHHSPTQAQAPNDRPFKCDQCVQSFNRNHDLKRHKRIHLAVKPYPCGHCDKSFSRKDALKRHILVKGCGKATANHDSQNDGSVSPTTKSDDTQ